MKSKPCSKKQLDYAKEIAALTGKELPEYLNQRTVSAYIAKNADEFREKRSSLEKEQFNNMIQRICEDVDIVSYASELGYHPKRIGRYYTLEEHDSVRIDPDKNRFWQNSVSTTSGAFGQGGNVIDFAEMFGNITQADAIKALAVRVDMGYQPKPTKVVQETISKKENDYLKLPQADSSMRNVFAYLTKTRYLHPDVVQDFVKNKMLYQDTNKNCVFVAYDQNNKDKPVFAMRRGTNTYKRFVGDVFGCDYDKGFYINNQADKLIVTESVIDAMSVMTIMHDNGENYHDYDYMPLAGATKFKAVLDSLKQNYKSEVVLALDNDKGGIDNANALAAQIQQDYPDIAVRTAIPTAKDWNAELQNFAKTHGWAKGLSFNPVAKTLDKSSMISKAIQEAQETYRGQPQDMINQMEYDIEEGRG